jgi:hypothetical protein
MIRKLLADDLAPWLVAAASQLLEPGERDAVNGDLEEAGESGWRALLDVLGLVVRRQAALWRHFGGTGVPGLPLLDLLCPAVFS